jgi:hypothetical protein
MTNPFRYTLLSKNASANHLESHSCENKGLKVPCFHTLTKNIGGRGCLGVSLSDFVLPISCLRFSLTPLGSALTSKRPSKSFTCNTYEKHTQGEGVVPHRRRIAGRVARNFAVTFPPLGGLCYRERDSRRTCSRYIATHVKDVAH